MNKILKKDYPRLFANIGEAIIEDSRRDHRRGSNFFTQSIVEFKPEHQEYYDIDLTPFLGTWETNTYLSDYDHGTDWDEILELRRVEKKEKTVVTTSWEPV